MWSHDRQATASMLQGCCPALVHCGWRNYQAHGLRDIGMDRHSHTGFLLLQLLHGIRASQEAGQVRMRSSSSVGPVGLHLQNTACTPTDTGHEDPGGALWGATDNGGH